MRGISKITLRHIAMSTKAHFQVNAGVKYNKLKLPVARAILFYLITDILTDNGREDQYNKWQGKHYRIPYKR